MERGQAEEWRRWERWRLGEARRREEERWQEEEWRRAEAVRREEAWRRGEAWRREEERRREAGRRDDERRTASLVRELRAKVEAERAAETAADEEAALFWREVRALEDLEAAKRRVLEDAGAAYPQAPAASWIQAAMAEVAAEMAAAAAPARGERRKKSVHLTSDERKRLKRNQPR